MPFGHELRTEWLPSAEALTGNLAHTGVIGTDIRPVVERPLASSVLPDVESSG
jgi:hypothetical protein